MSGLCRLRQFVLKQSWFTIRRCKCGYATIRTMSFCYFHAEWTNKLGWHRLRTMGGWSILASDIKIILSYGNKPSIVGGNNTVRRLSNFYSTTYDIFVFRRYVTRYHIWIPMGCTLRRGTFFRVIIPGNRHCYTREWICYAFGHSKKIWCTRYTLRAEFKYWWSKYGNIRGYNAKRFHRKSWK